MKNFKLLFFFFAIFGIKKKIFFRGYLLRGRSDVCRLLGCSPPVKFGPTNISAENKNKKVKEENSTKKKIPRTPPPKDRFSHVTQNLFGTGIPVPPSPLLGRSGYRGEGPVRKNATPVLKRKKIIVNNKKINETESENNNNNNNNNNRILDSPPSPQALVSRRKKSMSGRSTPGPIFTPLQINFNENEIHVAAKNVVGVSSAEMERHSGKINLLENSTRKETESDEENQTPKKRKTNSNN
jgi:hypothetical protein